MRVFKWALAIVLVCSTTGWGYYISDVTVSPAEPNSADEVVVTVSGYAPATNYAVDHVDSWVLGHIVFVDVYWTSIGSAGGAAMTPYDAPVSLGTLREGSYTLYVRSLYEGRVRARETKALEVCAASSSSGSTWSWSWSWDGWPGFSFSSSLNILHGWGNGSSSIIMTSSIGNASCTSTTSTSAN